MTLLEMTVVILVILTLIGSLFIGARSWMRGSNKSSCVMNIRNVQQAVRAHQNLNKLDDGASLDVASDLTGPGNFIGVLLSCPEGGTYSYETTIPSPGTLVMTCSLGHEPDNYSDW